MTTNVQYPTAMMDYHRSGFRQPAYHQSFQRKPLTSGQYPPAYPQPPHHHNHNHSRSRTTSSNVLPTITPSSTSSNMIQNSPTYSPNYGDPTRRLSTATTSTTSTGGQITRTGTNNSGGVQRSTSSRSASSSTSYVALMRKQKATVWCDRAQPEDPRVAAAQRAAKHRATLEINGGGSGRASSYSGKIRHGTKTSGYSPANLSGAGVPLRLSANEVGENDDEFDDSGSGRIQNRTGSGRSSVNSNRYPNVYQRHSSGRPSSGSTPPNEYTSPSDETPMGNSTKPDYFEKESAGQGGSGGSGTPERENSFGDVKEMTGPTTILKAAENAKKAEELRRRGSVDDRTMTMSGVRLFVANPDLDD